MGSLCMVRLGVRKPPDPGRLTHRQLQEDL